MRRHWVAIACAALFSFCSASSQEVVYKSTVVALTDDAALRAHFEQGLVQKALGHNYDAVTSYDLVPSVDDVDSRRFRLTLAQHGIRTVLMVRPAAIGAGSSLEAVRNEVTPELLANMRSFAKEVSASDSDDLIAVVHMAIYVITEDNAELISSGAVWLDEPVDDREQGIERLQDLIVANVDAARPSIRRRLGLPPLQ
jgi:hypothetical protein